MTLLENGGKFAQTLAGLISEIAERRGVSQNQLAKMSGVSQSQVSRIYKLERAISVSQFYALANALDVDVSTLVAIAVWSVTGERPNLVTDEALQRIFERRRITRRDMRMKMWEEMPWWKKSLQ